MTDDKILSEFFAEYRQSPRAEEEKIVLKFNEQYGVDFLSFFFSKNVMQEYCRDCDYYDLAHLIGSHLYLLDELNKPIAGEIADIYLSTISAMSDLDTSDSYDVDYIEPALKILIKHKMNEKAVEYLYKFFGQLSHSKLLLAWENSRISGPWARLLIQLEGLTAIDYLFRHLFMYDAMGQGYPLFKPGGWDYFNNIFKEMISSGPENVEHIAKLTAEFNGPIYDDMIQLLIDIKFPRILNFVFSCHGVGCEKYLGSPVPLPDIEYTPVQILDCIDASLPFQTMGVLCYLFSLPNGKEFVENLESSDYVILKFTGLISTLMELDSSERERMFSLAIECAGMILRHSSDISIIRRTIESGLEDTDWKRRASIVYILLSLVLELKGKFWFLIEEKLNEYDFFWILEKVFQVLSEEFIQNWMRFNRREKPQGVMDLLEGETFDFDDNGLYNSIRVLVTNPLVRNETGGNPH